MTDQPPRTPLLQGLAILEYFATTPRATVAEVARHFGMPMSTVYRYVRQLWQGGYLYRIDGAYSRGRKSLVESTGSDQHLVTVARPVLTSLRDATDGPALLSVRVESVLLCLDVVSPPSWGPLTFRPGQVQSLHAGASAEVLLAFAPAAVVDSVTARPLRRYTAKTPEVAQLRERLATVRRHGYAVSYGELTAGIVGVAAPVLHDRQCVCAVSSVAPQDGVGARLDQMIGQVRDAARALAEQVAVGGGRAWHREER
ncbi:IclR family transcriptional regulator [Amycolatopsis endophytica]|uniref:DNA-binding IclR family transcriptional regulator n=1 Tax=Amycolatopsis endophytica TaxID=860233 RepID=A0A853BA70_9PSEU|nr:IclR family transcriptional regulator [Amycolatopsis endophytica]NYI91581.1 DNA-binding IclR family transcriptional regulator [Amycolatopsis endophytica]